MGKQRRNGKIEMASKYNCDSIIIICVSTTINSRHTLKEQELYRTWKYIPLCYVHSCPRIGEDDRVIGRFSNGLQFRLETVAEEGDCRHGARARRRRLGFSLSSKPIDSHWGSGTRLHVVQIDVCWQLAERIGVNEGSRKRDPRRKATAPSQSGMDAGKQE